MKRPMFMNVPCGQVLGHGLACCEGYMCSQCEYILQLETALNEMREALECYAERDYGTDNDHIAAAVLAKYSKDDEK